MNKNRKAKMFKKRKHIAIFAAITIVISASAHAAVVTGDLSYDSGTGLITSTSGLTYLGWEVAADLTYAETIISTLSGGIYGEFHIASQTEAFTFFNAVNSGADVVDVPGQNFHFALGLSSSDGQGRFGNNFNANNSYAYFLSDESGFDVGILTSTSISLIINDSWAAETFESADLNSSNSDLGVSWLLVKDASVVPVPAAIWLFGSGLIGLFVASRRKKT